MPAAAFGHLRVEKPEGRGEEGWYQYTCGHCGNKVSGAVLARVGNNHGGLLRWLQCSVCHDASVQTDSGAVYPPSPYGPTIEGLPETVEEAYEEARRCMSVAAFTAAELICRKILMHVAVDKGAKEGEPFEAYVDFLGTQGYVTPPMRPWVTLIRKHGNLSTHRIPAPDMARAEGTVQFLAQLLRSVYEMDHLAKKFAPPPPKSP